MTLPVSTASAAEETAFQQILARQMTRYPRLAIQDLYKLIYQAALGAEHAVPDVAAAQEWLARELSQLGAGPPEPIVDTISPDGCIVRVHLRPYMAAGGDPGALLTAFVRTAQEHGGTGEQLRRYWSYAVRLAAMGGLPFNQTDLLSFWAGVEAQGLPVVHHSAGYRDAYKPAYRVIRREFLLWEGLTKSKGDSYER
jgi:hypothetical protein